MEKKRIILPDKRYKKAPDENLSFKIKLEEVNKSLNNGDRNVVLDVNELFNEERNESLNYKIYGKIRMVFKNLYFGDVSDDYEELRKKLYLVGDGSNQNFSGYLPYDEFAFIRQDYIHESVPELSVDDLNLFTGFTTEELIVDESKYLTPVNASYYNWNFYLTYVNEQDDFYPMTYTSKDDVLNFVSSDGIPFEVTELGNFYVLTSPVEHGMNTGEYVIIDEEVYYINSTGNENYNSEKYIIKLLKTQIPSGTTFNQIVTGKRCIDNTNIENSTSQYYIHKHKTLTDINDYVIDNLGFESSIWKDEKKLLLENSEGETDVLVVRNRMENVLYDFKNPLVLNGLTNNLGYTPTEVYVTIVFKNTNEYFITPPKVGYKFNFHDSWIDEHFIGTGSTDISLYNLPLEKGDDGIIGSFIEYIPSEMRERTISETFHKITNPTEVINYGQTGDVDGFSGSTIDNPFGLFYQSHYRVKLRELSPYIEVSNSPVIDNLPENAKYLKNEKLWVWRDLYDHGYIDDLNFGTDFPFMNNIHYVKNDINFFLRNERYFTNKKDGLYDFNIPRNNNPTDNINC